MTIDQATRQFLSVLHRGGGYGYWWTLESRQSFWWEVGKIAPLPDSQRNIYFGIHPTIEIPKTNARGEPKRPQEVRSQNALIAAVNCLFVEYDAKDFGDDKDAAFRKVESLNPPTSVVVDSGGGFHCYWLLDQSWVLNTEEQRERARKLQAAWVRLMDGDPQSKDLARVLRVPGTLNHKYQPAHPVEFVWCGLNTRYAIDELAALAQPFIESDVRPQAEHTNGDHSRWLLKALAGEIAKVVSARDGLKHERLLDSAVALGGLVHLGLSEQEIEDGLYAAIEGRAADAKNARKTIQDGIAYGKAKPRKIPPRPEQQNGEKSETNGHKANGKAPLEKALDRPARSRTILDALEKLGYTFRLNLCTDTVEVNGVPMGDPMQARVRTEMRDLDFRGMSAIEDTYTTEALRNAYHPIRDYLDSLVWDGGLHFEALTTYLECTDDPVVYPDGTTIPLCNVYLWRWMIGAVAKVYEQAQNLMLVLAGPQDLGKSTFTAWLCSGLPSHFIEAPINPSDKDMDVRLMGRFIWEVSELDATTRRADVAALKAFITKRVVTVRKSYGRHDTVKPAVASLVGTVNDGSGFLADETGNRRFFVTTLSRLDWSYNKLDINQIWAQIVAAYRDGEPWRLLPVEAAAQTTTNKLHEVDGLLEDWIERYFILCQDGAAMTASEIADHLRTKYEIRLSGSERAQAMEIARVMVKFKIPRRQRGGRGVREYVGIYPKEQYNA